MLINFILILKKTFDLKKLLEEKILDAKFDWGIKHLNDSKWKKWNRTCICNAKGRREANLKDKILINNNMFMKIHQAKEAIIANYIECDNHKEEKMNYSIFY